MENPCGAAAEDSHRTITLSTEAGPSARHATPRISNKVRVCSMYPSLLSFNAI
jgi:hypothetical protein